MRGAPPRSRHRAYKRRCTAPLATRFGSLALDRGSLSLAARHHRPVTSRAAGDLELLTEVKRGCDAARAHYEAADVPHRPVPTLTRTAQGLVVGSESAVDWGTFTPLLTRASGFWEQLGGSTSRCDGDEEVQ